MHDSQQYEQVQHGFHVVIKALVCGKARPALGTAVCSGACLGRHRVHAVRWPACGCGEATWHVVAVEQQGMWLGLKQVSFGLASVWQVHAMYSKVCVYLQQDLLCVLCCFWQHAAGQLQVSDFSFFWHWLNKEGLQGCFAVLLYVQQAMIVSFAVCMLQTWSSA